MDIDSLQLHIVAQDKASGVLRSLAKELGNLGAALKTINTKPVDNLANSLSRLSDIGKLQGTSNTIRDIVSSFAATNNIDKRAIPQLTEQYERLFKAFATGKDGQMFSIQEAIHNLAAEKITLRKEVDDIYRQIQEVAHSYKGKLGLGDLKGEFGDDFNDFRKMLGGTSKMPGGKLQSIDGLLQELKGIQGVESVIDFSSAERGAHSLYDALKLAKQESVDLASALSNGKGVDSMVSPQMLNDKLWEDILSSSDKVKTFSEAFTDLDPDKVHDYFGSISTAINELQGSGELPDFTPIKTLATSISALGNSKVTAAAENLPVIADGLHSLEGVDIPTFEGLRNLAGALQAIGEAGTSQLQQAADSMKDLNDSIANSNVGDELSKASGNLGEMAENAAECAEQVKKVADVTPKKDIIPKDDGTKDAKKGSQDLLVSLLALGHEIDKLAKGFDRLANTGVAAMKAIYKPMDMVVDEYKEKFTSLLDSMRKLSSGVQVHLKKMSDFWKRSMRTFTFMLVRKAITTFLKEMKDAIGSLAQFESAMGGVFNESMSNAVADLSYIGRALLGAFEPIINVVVPILDTLAAAIARVMALLGHFFAALTGQGYYVTAKKNVTDYAASLDKASKSQKNLTMGIDELNILNESKGGGASASNPMDEWDLNEVEGWMKNFADKFKDFWNKIFAPLKEAWDAMKKYLLDSFNYMVDQLKKLFAAIAKDFLDVWNQDKTIEMFKNLLGIVGDLMVVVGNLARQFRNAWTEAGVGKRILENIRDILAILVQHARNITQYMKGWSGALNFKPLLNAVEKATAALKHVAEFVGGVFEDIFKRIILPYIKWFIEEGTPHMLKMIERVINSFDWIKIRNDLKPVETAFEKMLENIHTGVTNAIGNLGRALAKWTNSKEFTDFLEAIAHIMGLITADRVEKLFTALGTAILNMAQALARFVSSDAFLKFLDAVAAWYDSLSVDQLAHGIELLAGAIVGFKFVAFVGEGLAGFLSFLTMITAAKNIGSIAHDLAVMSGSAAGLKEVGTAAGGISTVFAALPKIIATAAGAFAEFFLVKDGAKGIAEAIDGGDNSITAALTKMVAGIAVGSAAFIAAFGVPAGLIAAAVLECISIFAGFNEEFENLKAEQLGESIKDALLSPGGVPLDDLINNLNDKLLTIGESFQQINSESDTLEAANENIEGLVQEIGKINGAMASGVMSVEEGSKIMVEKFTDLERAVKDKLGTAMDILLLGFGEGGAIAKAYELTAQESEILTKHIVDNTSEQEKQFATAKENYLKYLEAGNTDQAQKYYQQMIQLSQGADELATKQANLSDAAQNGLNWDQYINANTGEPLMEEMVGALDGLYSKANSVSEEFTASIDSMKEAARSANDNETLNLLKTGYPDALKNMNEGSAREIQGITDMMQTNLVLGIKGIMEDAQAKWNDLSWYQKLLKPDGLDGFIKDRVDAYKTEYIDPLAQNIETGLGELGVQGAGWGSEAADEIIKSVFLEDYDYTEAGAIASTKLQDGWQAVFDELNPKLETMSAESAKVIDSSTATAFLTADEAQAAVQDWTGEIEKTLETVGDNASDYGKDTVDGYNKGIEDNASSSQSPIEAWFNNINTWIHDNSFMPFGSPNEKTYEYGGDTVEGYNKGIEENSSTTNDVIDTWFTGIADFLATKMVEITTMLTEQSASITSVFDQITSLSDTKFKAMATKIVTAFTTMRDGTITAITGMAEMLTAKYIEIEVATQTFVETINMMFLDMTTGVADRITEFTTVLVDRFNDMTERVCQTVDRMRERLIDRYDDMKNRLSKTMERIDQDQQRKWEHITDTVERQNEKIKDRIEKSWENNKKVIEDKMQKIKESVEKNFEQIAQKVENKCEKIKQKIDKLGERLEKFASENLPNWADAWRGTWEDIKGVVSSACAEILDMVHEMVAEVEAAFAGLKYGLVGDPIVIDMWDDIEDAFGKGSDNSLAEVEDLAENVADSFMDMADEITESPMFTGLVDSAAKSMDGVINVVDGALENVKSLFDTELSFPTVDAEMPQFNVNPDMGMPQTSFAENEAAMNNVISSMKSQMDGATTDDAIKNEIAQQSDQEQRLFNTMIDLLQDLVKKDTNVYMDSRSMVSTLNNRSRRNGYDFRMA